MKNMNGFAKRLACALLSALLCAAVLPSTAEVTTPMFPWLSYTLTVALCTDDVDDAANRSFATGAGERLVRVVLEGVGVEVQNDEIDEYYDMFVLRDDAGRKYGVRGTAVHGISFVNGKPGKNPMQEGFDLFFVISVSIPLDDLVLLIDTDKPNEHIIVRMTDVPRET